MSKGYDNSAIKIHSVYRAFCHQRVERSLFLFGEDSIINVYTRDELRDMGVLPESNPYVPEAHSHDIYGYPYIGNDQIGYKMALCVRDLAIWLGVVITGAIYLLISNKTGKVRKYDWKLYFVLMVPMAIDGTFQLIAEVAGFPWVPEAYFASIWKRLITGGLFGLGFALLVFSNIKESSDTWYNADDKGDNEPSGIVKNEEGRSGKNGKSKIKKEK